MRGWAAGRPVSLDLFQEVKHDFFRKSEERIVLRDCGAFGAWHGARRGFCGGGAPRRPRMQLQAMTRLPCWWNPAIQPPAGVSTMASPLPFQRRSLLPAKMRKMSRETMVLGAKTRVISLYANSVVPGTGITIPSYVRRPSALRASHRCERAQRKNRLAGRKAGGC